MKSTRRIEEVELQEDLSFDEIVKNTWKNAIGGYHGEEVESFDEIVANTWKNAIGGWNLGKKDEEETEELTRAQKRRNEKRKKRKKNPIFEMMINMATKGATKYVMNKLGLEHSKRRGETKKREKFNPFKVLWGLGGDSDEEEEEEEKSVTNLEKVNDEEKKEDVEKKTDSAIMTLDLDELL